MAVMNCLKPFGVVVAQVISFWVAWTFLRFDFPHRRSFLPARLHLLRWLSCRTLGFAGRCSGPRWLLGDVRRLSFRLVCWCVCFGFGSSTSWLKEAEFRSCGLLRFDHERYLEDHSCCHYLVALHDLWRVQSCFITPNSIHAAHYITNYLTSCNDSAAHSAAAVYFSWVLESRCASIRFAKDPLKCLDLFVRLTLYVNCRANSSQKDPRSSNGRTVSHTYHYSSFFHNHLPIVVNSFQDSSFLQAQYIIKSNLVDS
jgi:hypothetical protein